MTNSQKVDVLVKEKYSSISILIRYINHLRFYLSSKKIQYFMNHTALIVSNPYSICPVPIDFRMNFFNFSCFLSIDTKNPNTDLFIDLIT